MRIFIRLMFLILPISFASEGREYNQNELILVTAKEKWRPPRKLEIQNTGRVVLTFAIERGLTVKTLLEHRNDTAYLMGKRFSGTTKRYFNMKKSQYRNLEKLILAIPTASKPDTNSSDSNSVFLEYRDSKKEWRLLGKYPGEKRVEEVLCRLFDPDSGYVSEMYPLYNEDFGLICGTGN